MWSLDYPADVCSTAPPTGGRSHHEEAALVTAAQRGNLAAFTALVTRYERGVYRLIRNITQNAEDAEDALQETFLKAYQHLNGFQRNSTFYTWLVRIGINEALMKLRQRKGDGALSLDEVFDTGEDCVTYQVAARDPNPEQIYSTRELRAILDRALQELPPKYGIVFALRDIEGLSERDTAAALNLSAPAVKSRVQRARWLLRERLARPLGQKGPALKAAD